MPKQTREAVKKGKQADNSATPTEEQSQTQPPNTWTKKKGKPLENPQPSKKTKKTPKPVPSYDSRVLYTEGKQADKSATPTEEQPQTQPPNTGIKRKRKPLENPQPSKKTKKTPKPNPSYASRVLYTATTKVHYRKINMKPFKPEPPILLNTLKRNCKDIYEAIKDRGWKRLLEQTGEINETLIKEFYNNWEMKDSLASAEDILEERVPRKVVPTEVMVRGVNIKFTAEDLNEYLGAPNGDHSEFLRFVRKTDYKAIRAVVCGGSTVAQWDYTKDGHRRTLHRDHFIYNAKVWQNFVLNRVHPKSHQTNEIKYRVCLIYFLMKGYPLNLGSIILDGIERVRYGFPGSLIYGATLTSFLTEAWRKLNITAPLRRPSDIMQDPTTEPFDITDEPEDKPHKITTKQYNQFTLGGVCRMQEMLAEVMRREDIPLDHVLSRHPLDPIEQQLMPTLQNVRWVPGADDPSDIEDGDDADDDDAGDGEASEEEGDEHADDEGSARVESGEGENADEATDSENDNGREDSEREEKGGDKDEEGGNTDNADDESNALEDIGYDIEDGSDIVEGKSASDSDDDDGGGGGVTEGGVGSIPINVKGEATEGTHEENVGQTLKPSLETLCHIIEVLQHTQHQQVAKTMDKCKKLMHYSRKEVRSKASQDVSNLANARLDLGKTQYDQQGDETAKRTKEQVKMKKEEFMVQSSEKSSMPHPETVGQSAGKLNSHGSVPLSDKGTVVVDPIVEKVAVEAAASTVLDEQVVTEVIMTKSVIDVVASVEIQQTVATISTEVNKQGKEGLEKEKEQAAGVDEIRGCHENFGKEAVKIQRIRDKAVSEEKNATEATEKATETVKDGATSVEPPQPATTAIDGAAARELEKEKETARESEEQEIIEISSDEEEHTETVASKPLIIKKKPAEVNEIDDSWNYYLS